MNRQAYSPSPRHGRGLTGPIRHRTDATGALTAIVKSVCCLPTGIDSGTR